MFLKKLVSILLVLLLITGMFVGCSKDDGTSTSSENTGDNSSTTEEPKKEESSEPKVLRILDTSDIPSLDQSIATDTVSFEVLGNTLEGLFALVGENKLQNGVAESYTVSEDGKTYTFKLRKDSVWTNGEKVTAHDFIYSWRRLVNPETASQYAFMIETANFKNASAIMNGEKPVEELGVTATDDYTIVAELEAPVPFLANLLSFPSFFPINQKFQEAKGDAFGTSIDNTLFNGPYVLDKWETEFEYAYKKNENYWNKDNIKLDYITARIVKDPNTALSMYETDEIDVVGLSGEQVAQYEGHEDMIESIDTSVFYLQLNQKNEILKNLNARKAFALAFDKSFITDEILANGSLPADYLVPVNLASGPDGKDFRATTKTYMSYDKAKAQEYWAKAKEELGITTATIEFLTYDGEVGRRISEYLQGQLQANLEGLTVEIMQQPFKNKLALEDEGNFDFSFAGWGPDYGDPMTFLDMWITDSGHNVVNYSSEEYDTIIQRTKMGDLTTDLEKRWSELQRAEKILLEDDVAIVPLYQRAGKRLRQSYVKNYTFNAFAPDRYFGFMDIQK